MEKNELRKKALESINRVRWIPSWGRDRIYGMVENRPDWCISRQRLWGVPIILFYCKDCDTVVYSKEIFDHVVGLMRERGADVWFEREPKELMPAGTACPNCKGTTFRQGDEHSGCLV